MKLLFVVVAIHLLMVCPFVSATRVRTPDGRDPSNQFLAELNGLGSNYGDQSCNNRQLRYGNNGRRLQYSCGNLTPGALAYVTVIPLFWSSTVANQSGILAFYNGITQSKHVEWLSECKQLEKNVWHFCRCLFHAYVILIAVTTTFVLLLHLVIIKIAPQALEVLVWEVPLVVLSFPVSSPESTDLP